MDTAKKEVKSIDLIRERKKKKSETERNKRIMSQ